MRKTSIIFSIAIAGSLLAAASCKKEDTTDTTPSLTGLTINEAIPYVAVGESLIFKANTSSIISSKTTATPGTIGLYWQVNSAQKDTLSRDIKVENPEYEYHVDTLGSYSITCYAYSEGFYNASAITTFQAIDPSKALDKLNPAESVTIGGKEWTAMNLNNTSSGVSYKNAKVVDSIFGRFYTHTEAMTACPSGWHLPTAAEWDALGEEAGAIMANATFLDNAMWSVALGQNITNSTGFNAIPVGYYDSSASTVKFRRYEEMAAFWTASDGTDTSMAQFRYVLYDNPKIMKGNGDKNSLALSVRCVKD